MGTAGFVLYFFYDINSLKWQNKILSRFFWLGTACVLVSAVWAAAVFSDFSGRLLPEILLYGAAGVLFLVLLLYTLFLPFLSMKLMWRRTTAERHAQRESTRSAVIPAFCGLPDFSSVCGGLQGSRPGEYIF